MRALGIDPGFDRVGVAIVEDGGSKGAVLYSACIQTNARDPFPDRLIAISEAIAEIITKWHPTCSGIETLFFTKNQKTALKVAEARGVIVHEIARARVPIHEYTPLQIKNAIAGYGSAPKSQVEDMVYALTTLPKTKRVDDELDAIAVALTTLASTRATYPQK